MPFYISPSTTYNIPSLLGSDNLKRVYAPLEFTTPSPSLSLSPSLCLHLSVADMHLKTVTTHPRDACGERKHLDNNPRPNNATAVFLAAL